MLELLSRAFKAIRHYDAVVSPDEGRSQGDDDPAAFMPILPRLQECLIGIGQEFLRAFPREGGVMMERADFFASCAHLHAIF